MSATVFTSDEQVPESSVSSNEPNNNNGEDRKKQDQKLAKGPANKKRASVQSNSSLVSSNGISPSATTSGSSQTDDDDEDDDDQDNQREQMSNEEYERIRNTTLLFFLDRLCLASHEGKEARTLHDLSCLFGTREFTKEMRQIVGASRNGLKKFLQSYPSLFQIEDDKVYLTQLNGAGSQVSQRDYNKEAVEYFKQKLLQFGTSLVPIKNLFGYRSQASQEVRHVSGKNSRDFKRFLKQNEDVFEILADEHVVLKSALRELESQGMSSLSLQQSLQPVPAEEATTLDPYLNKQLAHLIEDCIRKLMAEQEPPVQEDQFKVTLEHLYEIIRKHCQNELFLKMVKTIEDLKVFLRMHPKLFKRIPVDRKEESDGNLSESVYNVGLVSEAERRELESQAYRASSLLQRQQSSIGQSTSESTPTEVTDSAAKQSQQSVGTTLPNEPIKSVISEPAREGSSAKLARLDKVEVSEQKSDSKCNREEGKKIAPRQQKQPLQVSHSVDRVARQSSLANNQQHLASHKLRANAPPFVPSRPQVTRDQQGNSHHNNHHQQPLFRQNSLLTQGYNGVQVTANLPVAISSGGQQNVPVPIQRSLSSLSPSFRSHTNGSFHEPPLHNTNTNNYHKRPADLSQFDRRAPIRSYANKGVSHQHNQNWNPHNLNQQQPPTALQRNAPLNIHNQNGGESQHQSLDPILMQRSNSTATAPPVVSQDDLRARTVDIVREASNIITKIMTTTDAVAFDCKGYNLGFDGKITMIQFGFLPTKQVDPMQLANSMNKRFASTAPTSAAATIEQAARENCENENKTTGQQQAKQQMKPEVCVFDLITNPELAYCLKPLLESDKVVKIVHDVRNKSNALHVQFNIILNNVFDTQVANLVIQQQITGKPAYKSRYISMGKLCEIYGGNDLARYRDLIKVKTTSRGGGSSSSRALSSLLPSSKDVNYWRTRPLTRAMILEATMDVYCLVGGIYQNLKAQIKPEYEPLFDLLNLEGVLARIKPEEIRSAKKERKIDMEVIDLKRKLYSDSTGPVVLSNREIRLLRHIDLTEGVRQKIQQCKKVANKLERLDMKAALLKQQQEGGVGGTNDQQQQQQPISLNSPMSSLNSHSNASSLNIIKTDSEVEQRQEQLRARLDEFNAAVLMMEDNSMFDELKERLNESNSLLESLENDDDNEDEHGHLSSGHHSHNGSSLNDCCRCQCHSNQQSSLDNATSGNHNQSSDATTKQSAQDSAVPSNQAPDSTVLQADSKPEKITGAPDNVELKDGSSKKVVDESQLVPNENKSSMLSDPKQSDIDQSQGIATRTNEQAISSTELTAEEDSEDSKSSACDMAVQCDLLN